MAGHGLGWFGDSGSLKREVAGWRSYLGYEILEAGDDICALELLVVAKTASNYNHSNECQRQVQLQSETHKGFIHRS